MRHLYILRHAKSDWGDYTLSDQERPLNARGRSAAALLGRYFHSVGLAPDLVLVSPAVRAVQTVNRLVEAGGFSWPQHMESRLYLADTRTLLDLIGERTPDVDRLMLVGHNPGLHDLAVSLAGSGDAALRRSLAAKLPTGGLVELMFDPADAPPRLGSGHLVRFVTPKSLTKA
ncbi:SixA phosphatase family protein [Yunchengibacter salinarum]|uniref:SixA phosphatase family protein n=1 Tax=Yunchengibacter salinarum TaxID=3133399 RepID=UPI0035B63434